MKTFRNGTGKVHAISEGKMASSSVCGRAFPEEDSIEAEVSMETFMRDDPDACGRCKRVLTQRGEVRDTEPGHRMTTQEAIRSMAAASDQGVKVQIAGCINSVTVDHRSGVTLTIESPQDAIDAGRALIDAGLDRLTEGAR